MFTVIPAAIIFVSNNLTDSVRDGLVKQLNITYFISGDEFDSRIAADQNFADGERRANNRVMVIRPFTDLQNRQYADLVIFVKQAEISIEMNKFGPPSLTMPINQLTWGKLGVFRT
jgi:hypothetical protein